MRSASIGMRDPEIQRRFDALERAERRLRDLELAAAWLQAVFGELRERRERRGSVEHPVTIRDAARPDWGLPVTQIADGALAESPSVRLPLDARRAAQVRAQ